MTRTDLAKAIAKSTNLTFEKAEKLVLAFGSTIEESLKRGEKIVYSNFGTFYTVHYPSKVILHPKYGAEKKMVMLPTNAVKWMPSGNIKALVNTGEEVENVTMHGSRRKLAEPKDNEEIEEEATKEEEVPVSVIHTTPPAPPTPPASEEIASDDEVEIPVKTNASNKTPEKSDNPSTSGEKPVNIYEELMGDGSKVESTFSDAIRVHKGKSFFNRIFNKGNTGEPQTAASQTQEAQDSEEKVSLAGAGIFDQHTSAKPAASIPVPPPSPAPIQATASAAASVSAPVPAQTLNATEKPQTTNDTGSSFEKFSILNPFGKKQPKPEEPEKSELLKEIKIAPFLKENPVVYKDLSKVVVTKEVLQKIPEKISRKYKLAPIEEKDDAMVIAMTDPEDIEAKEIVKKIVQKKIEATLASEEDINRILDQYSGLEAELKEAIETVDEGAKGKSEAVEDEVKKEDLIEISSENAPAARVVTSLLRRAIREKASDIHIEPGETDVEVRFRVDGVLSKKASLPQNIQSAVISRVKILSNMKIDEQRLPQDGRFSINVDNRKIDFRVSTMPVANGEKVVMRVLDKATGILTIEQLGLRGSALVALQKSIEKPHGMILSTGPTGSGKTTSLYALIDKMYTEGVNIVTLEDPIEYRMHGINQSQVNAEIDYTFASGLRSIVRQDPDIIMIGEIRDSETAEMAVHAALTGHVVLSTLHTNDAAGAGPRLLDMGVEPFLLTSSLNSVIGQRLARKICEDCREEVKIADEELAKIKSELTKLKDEEKKNINMESLKFFKGKGCKSCGDTGYKGRVGLFEVLTMSTGIQELILKKSSASDLQAKATEEGMITMLQDGIIKSLEGITTLEEVWRITEDN